LQVTLGFSPLRTGLAFLPLVGSLALSAFVASARLLAKTGPRPLIPVGMVLGMMGMILFTKLPRTRTTWATCFQVSSFSDWDLV